MASGSMTTAQSTAHAALTSQTAIPWQTILQLLIQYGPQIIAFILSILPLLKSGLPLDKALQWLHDAMDALQNHKPLPPLPTP